MTDLRQSPQFGKFTETIGWQVEKCQMPNAKCQIFIRKIPLLPFSIIKIQRPDFIPFEKIDEIAKKYRALFVKIEPNQQLNKNSYRADSWPLLCTKTIWIDLTKTENQLWKAVEKETRYCIRKAEKEDTKMLRDDDIEGFYENFKKFGKGYIPKKAEFQSLIKSFGKKAILLSANSLAGTLILMADKTAYYYYAFTSPLGRKKFCQHLLVWQAIKITKKLGCKIFDFEGIEDSRYKVTRKWQGFSHFKKSFGGKEITFPGSFTKYYNKILWFFSPAF